MSLPSASLLFSRRSEFLLLREIDSAPYSLRVPAENANRTLIEHSSVSGGIKALLGFYLQI